MSEHKLDLSSLHGDAVIKTEGSDDPAKIQIGDNPKHKMFMAWRVEDNRGNHVIQYHHGAMGFGTTVHNFSMHENDKFVGTMGLGKDGEIKHIEIHPEKRRQGLATKLYNFGHDLHEDISSIPAPKHSSSRTELGDHWAHAVGGELPEEHDFVEKHNYREARWTSLREPTIHALKSHLDEFHAKMIANGLDSKGMGDAKFHVESAHEYLTRAANMGSDHRDFSDTMNKAHEHIDELGWIHEDHYGDMDDHDRLEEHIGRLY